jgi:hypothetical protein
MFNAYVKALSDFDLFDADSTSLDMEPSVVSPRLQSFKWKKIELGVCCLCSDF